MLTISEIADAKQWNAFILSLRPNTFLQSWEWGEVQRRSGEGVRYLGLYENERQIGAALILTVKARRGKFLLCPHGPLFASDEIAGKHLPAVVEHLKEKAQKDSAVAIRIAPLLITTPQTFNSFRSLGFRASPLHVHTELTWMLDITKNEAQLLADMRKTTRHAVKKAETVGITTEISTDPHSLERFWPLYTTTKYRHGFVPFSKKLLQDQVALFGEKNQMFFVVAKHHDKDIATAILIHFGDTVFYHHGASVKLPSSLPASHAVQWAAIREAKRRGATRYNFWGIAPENEPKHPFAGITIFKKGFGGYPLDYLHAQDLSLSLKYWKLWAIEMYRKYKRGF